MSQARPTKLAICIPSTGTWAADFGYSLAQLCVHCMAELFEPGQTREVVFIDKRTSNLPRSRQECLEDALLQECTHALFIDTDQSFPPDTAHRLIRHRKPVVAASIPLKTIPSYPTARARSEGPFGYPIFSNRPDALGLEKVWRVGAGVMMIDLAILQKIEKPWFEIRYSDKYAQFVGEDWYFCKKVEDAGFDIFIDHDLSRQVAHIGQFQYTHAHIPAIAQEVAA